MSQLLTDLQDNQQTLNDRPATPKQNRKQAPSQGAGSPHALRFIAKHGDTFLREKIQMEQDGARQKIRAKSPSKNK